MLRVRSAERRRAAIRCVAKSAHATVQCGPWRSFEAVKFATLEWVDWFNHRRLLEPIGNNPPAEGEEQCYAVIEQLPMAA